MKTPDTGGKKSHRATVTPLIICTHPPVDVSALTSLYMFNWKHRLCKQPTDMFQQGVREYSCYNCYVILCLIPLLFYYLFVCSAFINVPYLAQRLVSLPAGCQAGVTVLWDQRFSSEDTRYLSAPQQLCYLSFKSTCCFQTI